MTVQNKSAELDQFAERILSGVNKALKKLVETAAAKNDSLVVSDGKGNVKSVPAKELLKNFSENQPASRS
jgi:hypothetical protein